MATILLLEDSPSISKINTRTLEQEGHTVLPAMNISEAREIVEQQRIDMAVLDIMLPDGSGLDFCRWLRHRSKVPVLFLTAINEKDSQLEGLRSGGDDYLCKPYDLEVFTARVEALLRRVRLDRESQGNGRGSSTSTYGPLTLDLLTSRAYLDGEDLLLSAKEFAMLYYLAQHAGETLSKEQLYEAIWNQPANDDARAIWTHMSRLRQKLGHSPLVELQMQRGKGYRFVYRQAGQN